MAAEQAMTTLAATHLEVVAFPIEGMTCASCVNRITRFLRKVDGVEEANVNLATESATVRYDGSRVDVAGLVAAVEAAGYTARVDRLAADAPTEGVTEEPSFADRHLADLRRRFTIAAILTIPLLVGLVFGLSVCVLHPPPPDRRG